MAQDCGSIAVTWSTPDVPVTVDRSTDTVTWTTVLRASHVGQATFLDTGLQALTGYYYRVTPLSAR